MRPPLAASCPSLGINRLTFQRRLDFHDLSHGRLCQRMLVILLSEMAAARSRVRDAGFSFFNKRTSMFVC